MSRPMPPRTLREGAARVEVYNEGLTVYLYDAQHELEVVRLARAAIESEEGDDGPHWRELAQRGLMVAYELYQDDGLSIDFVVGPPVTTKEKRAVPLFPPLRGPLDLPSGRLMVHSPNTAPFVDDPGEDAPGVFEAPPGRYVLSVHHVDFSELSRQFGEDAEFDLPEQLVVLTPEAETKPVRRPKPLLEFPDQPLRALRRWRVRDGAVHSEVVRSSLFGISPFITGVPFSAFQTLGIVPGDILELRLEEEAYQVLLCPTSLTRDTAAAVYEASLAEAAERFPYLLGGYFDAFGGKTDPRLQVFAILPNKAVDVCWDGRPLTIRPLGERVETPPEVPRGESRVLGASPHTVFLDARANDLGVAFGEDVQIEVAGVVRRLRLQADEQSALNEVIAFGLQPPNDRYRKELQALDAQRHRLIEAIMDADVASGKPIQAEIAKLEAQRGEYARPQEAIDDGMPWIAVPHRDWLDPSREILLVRALYYGATLEADLVRSIAFRRKR